MAIYHCSLKVFSRSKGHSAVAASAYRAGARLWDERRGQYHRYEKRKGVVSAFILTPDTAPEDFYGRAFLWNAAEKAENRKNSCVARELVLALPHELSGDQRSALVHDMAFWMVKRYSVAIDAAIHAPADGDGHDRRNHHAHLLFSTRELTEDGFGKKTRILDDKITGKAETDLIREVWETLANAALEHAGLSDIQIDRRSLEDQGIDRLPQTHLGPKAHRTLMAASSSRSVYEDTDDDDDGSSDRGGGGGSSPNAASSENEDERSEDTEEGGSSSSGTMGQMRFNAAAVTNHAPKANKLLVHSEKQTKPLSVTDLQSKAELYEYVSILNERREALPDTPLRMQIREVDLLIDVLHDEIAQLKPYLRKSSITDAIKRQVKQIIKRSSAILKARRIDQIKDQMALRADHSKQAYQQVKYKRVYRAGIKQQIKNMARLLTRLHTRKTQHKKLQLFYDHIDTQISRHNSEMIHDPKVSFGPAIQAQILMPQSSKPVILPSNLRANINPKPALNSDKRADPKIPENKKPPVSKRARPINDTQSIKTQIPIENNKIASLFKNTLSAVIAPSPVPAFIKQQEILPDIIRQRRERDSWFSQANISFKEADAVMNMPDLPEEQGGIITRIFNHDVPQKRTSIPEQLEDLKLQAPLLRLKIPKAFKPSKSQVKKVRVSKGFNTFSGHNVKPRKSFLAIIQAANK